MVTALVAGLALAIGACGEESSSGPVTLNFWAYNEPGGTFRAAADRCTAESNGRYNIEFNALGNDPNTQRQSLVRRLAAGDSSIDLMSMDVIWTAEFAEAGWILPFPDDVGRRRSSEGTLKGPLETATYEGKLYARAGQLQHAAALVPQGPRADAAQDVGGDDRHGGQDAEVTAASRSRATPYEGYTVWFNSLIQSAGGQILDVADQGRPRRRARRRRPRRSCSKLATSKAADPSLPAQQEDQNRARPSRPARPAFQVNYPFIYPSAPRTNKPELFKEHRLGAVPGGRRRRARARADRRLQLGRRRLHQAPGRRPSTRRRACATSRPARLRAKGGLPPTLSKALRRPDVQEGATPSPTRSASSSTTPRVRPRHARCTPTCRWRSTRRCRPPPSIDAQERRGRRCATSVQDALEAKGLL